MRGFKEIYIHFGMFDFACNVVLGPIEKLEAYVRWKTDWEDFKLGDRFEPCGLYIFHRGNCPILWLPKHPKTPREIATLAHEATHIAFCLTEWANIPVVDPTEEVVTHCVGFLVATVLAAPKR